MASLIPGYEYDVFISYRQKDNKYDGWVTEFVDNLKRELEATFKEDISVYFDINPHDGLLDTHDVDASLKEKIKCLVFIPIISRTYCDPKSFAWQHEFKAFIEEASKDQFGLKVKLPNGNVANRVLPVRIHDLDTNDILLCETVLGSVLRGVEFVYREPGVNRSLTPRDKEKKNMNGTLYRNQINKVANAIKEIVSGLIEGKAVPLKEKPESQLPWEQTKKEKKILVRYEPVFSKKAKLLFGIISVVIVSTLAVIYFYPKLIKNKNIEILSSDGARISIAVMPFKNMTNDTIWKFWQEGIQWNLITSLSNTRELKVIPQDNINTLFKIKGISEYNTLTPQLVRAFSDNLNASIIIYGSLQKSGQNIRIDAVLIDTKTKEILKSFSLERTASEKDIYPLTDSLSKGITSFLLISKLIKKEYPDIQIDPLSTKSPEAFRCFIYGSTSMSNGNWNRARDWYLKALALDSNFFDASAELFFMYENSGMMDQSEQLLLKLYKSKNNLSLVHQITLNWMYASRFESPGEKIKCLRQVEENDDQNLSYPYLIGNFYRELGEYDKAVIEYQKAIELGNKWGIKYSWAYPALAETYHKMGKYDEEKMLYKKVEQDNPDNSEISFSWIILNHAILSLAENDTVTANKYIARYIYICKENSSSEAEIATGLAEIYRDAGIPDKSEEYFRKALSLEPENPYRMNRLGWFLIDKERNINEGLALVEKALGLYTDKYNYFWCMDIKGWGLYKQKKYKEAQELYEKIWEQRPKYDYDVYIHFEEVKKAVAGQK